MIRTARNRGASLVTVIVVIAVSGILLAGALGLAYSHYKSIMLTETTSSNRAELDLCDELVRMSLDSTTPNIESLVTGETSPLLLFYTSDDEDAISKSANADSGIGENLGDDYLIIKIEDGYLTLHSNDEDFRKSLVITLYTTNWQKQAENTYSYTYSYT